MIIGIVTAATKKPERKKGLEDICVEVDSRDDVDYKVINPQNITFFTPDYMYLKRHRQDKFPIGKRGKPISRANVRNKKYEKLVEKFKDVDILYIRGFKPKEPVAGNYSAEVEFRRKAITWLAKELKIPISNPIPSIKYANNKSEVIIDISRSEVEIERKKIEEIIPYSQIFCMDDTHESEKEKYELDNRIKVRLQGAHTSQVLKTLDGVQGDGIMPIETGSNYRALLSNYSQSSLIVQDMIEDCVDLRVQIIGAGESRNDIKASYIRWNPKDGDFRAQNTSDMEHYDLNDFQAETSLFLHRRCGADHTAIDYGLKLKTREIFLYELNAENPGWQNVKKVYSRGLQKDMVDLLARKVLDNQN
ncbi:hypothetical protein GF374_02585 [Candidatus Woesearchaeota archaeon]|nr:hypothetical protein [Candidatus Woesearchaeota archaeon]